MTRRDDGAAGPCDAVASGHPATTAAAAELLAAGGNAFDAVVAAGFCASVVEPMLTSMAGGGFCLVHPAEEDSVSTIVDFFVDVPGRGRTGPTPAMTTLEVAFTATTQEFHCGWGSVAVPGALHGWLHVHERHGSLPLRDVVAPAVAAARAGVVVNDQQAYLFRILAPVCSLDPAMARRFVPAGAPLAAGALLVQPEVADFLEHLGADRDGAVTDFHRAHVAGSDAGGGSLTAADLDAYRVREHAPLRATYRGHELLTNPAPGGRLVAAQLADLAAGPPIAGWDDVEAPARFVAAQLAAEQAREPAATQGTTHVTVADRHGNVASMTTSNGTGSGQLLPGLGVSANNMLGEDDLFPGGLGTGTPGERVASMMSPTVVRADGDVVLALGSGGSKRIRTALTQVIARALDHEPDLAVAVEGPRVHHDGAVVQVEPGLPTAGVDVLRREHAVNEWDHHDLYFGGVHAVAPGRQAAGDPRRGGATYLAR